MTKRPGLRAPLINTAVFSASIGVFSIGACGVSIADTSFQSMLEKARTPTPQVYEGPTTPAHAPKGIKIAAITCYSILEGCVSPTKGIADAAKAIGWEAQTFDGGGTPSQQNSQILNAISWGANIIALIAVDPKAVQAGLQAAKRAGVLVVSGSSALSPPNPVVEPPPGDLWPAFDVMVDTPELGRRAADWIIADSGGKANVVIYNDKEFPSNIAEIEGLLPRLKECKGCTVQDVQYFTGTQVANTLGPETVSYLRNHPEVNYIYVTYDPAATAQVPAIENAGLAGNVKLVSILGDNQNLHYIETGRVQAADGAFDNEYMGWSIVDQSIRLLNHQPLISPIGENEPFVILDKTNLPKKLKTWEAPFEYKSNFLQLWK